MVTPPKNRLAVTRRPYRSRIEGYALLCASRQTYAEGYNYFFRQRTFRISASYWRTDGPVKNALACVSDMISIHAHRLSLIEHLELDVGIFGPCFLGRSSRECLEVGHGPLNRYRTEITDRTRLCAALVYVKSRLRNLRTITIEIPSTFAGPMFFTAISDVLTQVNSAISWDYERFSRQYVNRTFPDLKDIKVISQDFCSERFRRRPCGKWEAWYSKKDVEDMASGWEYWGEWTDAV